MENASKALIIAGAILLAILLIGLSMFIYQQATDALDGMNMNQDKITAYNSKFEDYEGTNSGTKAKALCDLIRNHNNGSVDDPSMQVVLTNTGTPNTVAPEDAVTLTSISTIKNSIKSGKTYTVSFGYDANSGYIVGVDIVEKKTSGN